MPKKKTLFGDDETSPAGESLRVNESYAKRFEHNKRREELHRLQAKHPEKRDKIERELQDLHRPSHQVAGRNGPPRRQESEEESTDDEEEDDGQIPDSVETKIFDLLLKIRKQDPVIYNPEVRFFPEPDNSDSPAPSDDDKQTKKQRPMYLKDVLAKQALEHGPELSSSDDEQDDPRLAKRVPGGKVYNEEQEELRRALLNAVEDADEAPEEAVGGMLKKRRSLGPGAAPGQQEVGKVLDQYFGKDDALDPNDKFLKEFILNKGWLDKSDDYVPTHKEVLGEPEEGEVEEDEEFLQQADRFEAAYNFRYEEPGGASIVTHPRVIGDSVRREDDRRKRKRQEKAARLGEEEAQRREELKRLKNLKKQEIEDRMGRIKHVAGADAPQEQALNALLEGDFDPDAYDAAMAAAFNDDYYEGEEGVDEILEGALEDEVMGGEDGEEGLTPAQKKLRKKLAGMRPASELDDGDGDGGDIDEGDGVMPMAEEGDGVVEGDAEQDGLGDAAAERSELQRAMAEYFKLDYEDVVAGMPTRFRYRQVPRSSYGLSVDDILALDDKALNQVVGMKRLAPYREDRGAQRPNYKALTELRQEMAAQGGVKKRRHKDDKKGQHGPMAGRFGRPGGWQERGPAAWQQRQQPPARRQHTDHERQHKPGQAKGEQKQEGQGNGEAPQGHPPLVKPQPQQAGSAEGGGKQQSGGGQRKQQQDPAAAAERKRLARLQSYGKLSLKKDGRQHEGGGQPSAKHAKKAAAQQAAPEPAGPKLSKAQKKNMKRATKRAAKKGTAGTPAS